LLSFFNANCIANFNRYLIYNIDKLFLIVSQKRHQNRY
jgi:hypothetical protein